jgi:hypothetical protein
MNNKQFIQSRIRSLIITFLLVLLFSGNTFAAETTLGWQPNSEEHLTGYKIHYGLTSGNYTTVVDVGTPPVQDNTVQAIISELEGNTTYYADATAYDAEGMESPYSEEVTWTTPALQEPLPPTPIIESIHEVN